MPTHKFTFLPLIRTPLVCVFILSAAANVYAEPYESETGSFSEEDSSKGSSEPSSQLAPITRQIAPFTGKITRNKVRMRTQANLDAPIIKELGRDEMVVIDAENDEFYAVRPPADFKAYVYRTYILDGVIEGNRVNVRLEPDLEAPVLTQLKTGDQVKSEVSPLNSKWAEIAAPEQVRFYVAKDYVEKVGDANLLGQIQKRREEVNRLLNSAYLAQQSELAKPFEEIHYDQLVSNFNNIIQNYSEYPEQVNKARELLASLKEDYIRKKISYLEAKTQVLENSQALSQTVKLHHDYFQTVATPHEYESDNNVVAISSTTPQEQSGHFPELQKPVSQPFSPHIESEHLTARMAQWIPIEKSHYDEWMHENPSKSLDQYYHDQYDQAVVLKGILEAYNRPVRNKPGDYLLMNLSNKLPTAYLYSTHVDLQNLIGHEVTIKVAPRPNNYFAFPAYYVLEVE